MNTLLLDPASWDLTKDAAGNIATASNPYALAQTAACAIKLFQAELWYDTTQGIPYFQQIFGKPPNVALIKTKFATAAVASDPDIVSAVVFITSIVDRNVRGQVQVTDSSGVTTAANF